MDPPAAALRHDFSTTDPGLARTRLSEAYGGLTVSVRPGGQEFSCARRGVSGPGFDVSSIDCRAGADGEFGGSADHVLVAHVVAGHLDLDSGGLRARLTPERPAVVPSPCRVGVRDLRVVAVRLERDRIERVAARLWDGAPSRVVFTALQPSSPELAGYWGAVLRHVREDVLADDALIGDPLVVADVAQRLAAAVLTVFPNTARDRDHAEPQWTGTAVLRRAMEFMDEHAHEPVTIDDVAAAARVGPRALQQAFRRHRGTTPLEYLREVRMQRAHRDLSDADPTRGDTVAAAAARWGFPHAGRFSVQYRERYGRSPRNTLRS